MQSTLDIRRHSDGSIDFDFYRRRAARRRRLIKRMAFRRNRMRLINAMRSAMGAIRRPSHTAELAPAH